jgi:hypothetical protein
MSQFGPRASAERIPSFLTDSKCLGSSPGAVQGEHELSIHACPQGVFHHQRLKICNHVAVEAMAEANVYSLFLNHRAKLVQPSHFWLGEVAVHDVIQHGVGALPQFECPIPQVGPNSLILSWHLRLDDQLLEPSGIDVFIWNRQQVPSRMSDKNLRHTTRRTIKFQYAPKPKDRCMK